MRIKDKKEPHEEVITLCWEGECCNFLYAILWFVFSVLYRVIVIHLNMHFWSSVHFSMFQIYGIRCENDIFGRSFSWFSFRIGKFIKKRKPIWHFFLYDAIPGIGTLWSNIEDCSMNKCYVDISVPLAKCKIGIKICPIFVELNHLVFQQMIN